VKHLSLRRIWLIAQRDYFGYVKTVGFWLSFLMPIVFGGIGILAISAGLDFQNTRYETILDTTGQDVGEDMVARYTRRLVEMRQTITDELPDAMQAAVGDQLDSELDNNLVLVPPPADTIDGLQPYLKGERTVNYEGEDITLDGALHIYSDNGEARARYWSSNVNADLLPSIARRYFRDRARANYLESGGLTLDGYDAATDDLSGIDTFDPTKPVTDTESGQAVSLTDRIPYWVATAAAAFLWFTVFAGAYMLLTSMLEEKLGKLMEMMLASTQFVEIMFGKLLGVALLTLTSLAPYIILVGFGAAAAISMGDPEVIAGIRQAITPKMLVFFPVFLILGYVFYGAFFIALGSLSESMQDAQTLTIPILLVLTACVLVVPAGLADPNAPLVVFASWFPFSAPFAAIIRIPADASWAMLTGSALLLFVSTIGVTWVATQIFKHGVLSGAGLKPLGAWFRRVVLRQKTVS